MTGTPYAAPGGVAPPAGRRPIEVVVSDDPTVRLLQAKSFFQRNPGTWNMVGFDDAVRGAMRRTPLLDQLAGVGEVTRYGVGQGFVDQVRWQVRTGRQPQDAWWMSMNKRSLEDPLLAEAYVRAGRQDELTSPVLQAWARYVDSDDAMQARLGLDPTAGYVGPGAITPDGAIPPDELASGTVAHRTPLRTRLELLRAMPGVRDAYWGAHNLSIQAAFDEFRPLLEASKQRHPDEGELQDSWGRFIDFVPRVRPPGNGSIIDLIQPAILPQHYPARREDMTLTQRLFVRVGRALGRRDDQPAAPAVPPAQSPRMAT